MAAAKFLSNKKGLVLIEALIATLIVGLVLISIVAAIAAQLHFINQNRENMLATLAAQEVIETIRGMTFSGTGGIINTNLNAKFNDIDDSLPQALSYLDNPVISVSRDDDVYADHDNIQRISVVVSWNSSGKALQRSLVTLVTNNGIDNK